MTPRRPRWALREEPQYPHDLHPLPYRSPLALSWRESNQLAYSDEHAQLSRSWCLLLWLLGGFTVVCLWHWWRGLEPTNGPSVPRNHVLVTARRRRTAKPKCLAQAVLQIFQRLVPVILGVANSRDHSWRPVLEIEPFRPLRRNSKSLGFLLNERRKRCWPPTEVMVEIPNPGIKLA